MHYVIFTGGLLQEGPAVTNALNNADVIIAADAGAKTAVQWHRTPRVVLGDFDSLDTETKTLLTEKGTTFLRSAVEKNETDTELAIQYALTNNATGISILGGIQGDRIDHILANIFLTTEIPIPVQFVTGNTIVWLEKGPKEVTVQGQVHDLLSLLPLSSLVAAITTTHLQYPLVNEALYLGKSRGISNVFLHERVHVRFASGLLLFIHSSPMR